MSYALLSYGFCLPELGKLWLTDSQLSGPEENWLETSSPDDCQPADAVM